MSTITIQEKVFNVTIVDKDTQSTVTVNPASATKVNISEKGFVGSTTDAVWGQITGTLSDQTDLQDALDLKFNTSDFDTSFDSAFSSKSTDDLSEGSTNLYFTDQRVIDILSAANVIVQGDDISLLNNDAGYITSASVITTHSGLTLDDGTNPHGTTKANVGLGNVDNTSDANKPISDSTQSALDLKFNTTDFNATFDARLGTKSTSDIAEGSNLYYTEARVTANASVAQNTAHRGIVSGNPHNVNKGDVGLGSVDNTSDADKPISTTQQAALDGKLDSVVEGTNISIDNTDPNNPIINSTASGGNGGYCELWAEENSNLNPGTNGGFQFSFGNGATNSYGVVIGFNCTIDTLSLAVENATTGTVEVYVNEVATGETVSISAERFNTVTGLTVPIVAGDRITFRTISGSGGGTAVVSCGMRSGSVPDELVNDTSPQLGGNLDQNGFNIIGLENVDNTSDANKPISAATQSALDLKFNTSDFNTSFDGAFSGKDTGDLSEGSNLYYTEGRVSANTNVSQNSAHSALTSGNPHNVGKTDVGLGNVDNTSDLDKPISTATQNALDAKEDTLPSGNAYDVLTRDASNNKVFSPIPVRFFQPEWVAGEYQAGTLTVDTGWTMLSNKVTEDRPSPQPSGDPLWSMPDEPLMVDNTDSSVVYSGQTYTFTESGWLERVRVWVPELTNDTNYRFVLADITDPANPIVEIVQDPVLSEDEWVTIAANSTIVLAGTVLKVYVDALNTGSSTNISGGWFYGGTDNNNEPPSQSWNRNNQNTLVRISKTDADSVDRSSELSGVTVDSDISFVQTSDTTKFRKYRVFDNPVDLGTSYGFPVVLTDVGPGGEPALTEVCTTDIDVPIPQPTKYSQLTGHFATNPSFATVEGFLEYDGTPQAGNEDNGFGIDLRFQKAVISEDWEYIAGLAAGQSTSQPAPSSNPMAVFDIPGSQSVTSTSFVALNLSDTSIKDSIYTHDDATNPSQIQVTASGRYKIEGYVGIAGSTGNYRLTCEVALRIDGVTQRAGAKGGYIRATTGAFYNNVEVSDVVELTAGQYIDVMIRRVSDTEGNGTTEDTHSRIIITKMG